MVTEIPKEAHPQNIPFKNQNKGDQCFFDAFADNIGTG